MPDLININTQDLKELTIESKTHRERRENAEWVHEHNPYTRLSDRLKPSA